MATRGVKITGLNDLPNSALSGNIILAVVDPAISIAMPDGETLQANLYQVGNFILEQAGNLFPSANVANTVRNNAQPNITSVGTLTSLTSLGTVNFNSANNVTLGNVANIHISGGNSGYVLHTYGNGQLYWDIDDDAFPGGPNSAVQFNNNNAFDGTADFTFDSITSTLSVTNIGAGNINVDTIYIGNFHLEGLGNGTQQQVLGIIDQDTQQLGWKTVPVYYITVDMRDGSNYLSSPDPVLRVYPMQMRDGTYLDLNVTQI